MLKDVRKSWRTAGRDEERWKRTTSREESRVVLEQ